MTAVQAVLALLILLSQLLAWRYLHARLRRKFLKGLLNLVYILFNILGIYALLTVFVLRFPAPSFFLWDFVVRPGLIWELVHLAWLVPAALISLAGAVWVAFFRREPKGLHKLFHRERPGPGLTDPVGLALAAMLALAFYGYTRQLAPPEIDRVEIAYPDLPRELDGFRLAVASDFHYGAGQNRQELLRAFELLAAERPHAVFLLGDLVVRDSLLAVDYKEPIGLLAEAPFGVWGILGNHDHYTENPHNIIQLLNGAGASILVDQRATLSGAPITVIGFDDPGTRELDLYPLALPQEDRPLPFDAVQGPADPQDNFTVALTHRPLGAADAAARGVDLYLAGHTRGGGFRLPWFRELNPASLYYAHTSGRYTEGGMEIYVTEGLSSPVSPFRLFAWPSMAIVTLKRGPKPEGAAEQPPAAGDEASPEGGGEAAAGAAASPEGGEAAEGGAAPAEGGAASPDGGDAAGSEAAPTQGGRP